MPGREHEKSLDWSGRNNRSLVEGLTAETFNAHHASIIPTAIIVPRYPSTSLNYRTSTSRKLTSFGHWTLYDPLLLESTKFPHGSCDSEPLFLLHLLPSSLINRYRRLGHTPMENSSYHPHTEGDEAYIQPTDFRPISVSSVLSHSLERFIVRSNIYPAFQHPPPGLV